MLSLSASSPSLKHILPLCPDDCRVAVWTKPFAIFKPNVNPAYTWEPVIFRGGRKRDRSQPTVRDHFSHVITLKKGLTGAKPEPVCAWIISLLGALPTDQFVDIFPGTGAFTRVWQKFQDGMQMPKTPPPLPPLVEKIARALNPIAWKYLNHEDDDNARKRRRTASIRNARNVLKELGNVEISHEALERVFVCGNHIATYRSEQWPDYPLDGLTRDQQCESALRILGAGKDYDMWCCWSGMMQVRDEVKNAPTI